MARCYVIGTCNFLHASHLLGVDCLWEFQKCSFGFFKVIRVGEPGGRKRHSYEMMCVYKLSLLEPLKKVISSKCVACWCH